jgi:cyclopropane-fatty-acyl-phospholipid synthase
MSTHDSRSRIQGQHIQEVSSTSTWLRWLIKKALSQLSCGRLDIETPDGQRIVLDTTQAGPHAVLSVHRWRALRRLMLQGDIGFAEAYIEGDWSSPDLASLIELVARNRAALQSTYSGLLPTRLLDRLRHLVRANTKRGSRRNIVAHYDLGNDFYARWLDAGMSYSSALYANPGESLEIAQRRKQDMVLDWLGLNGSERVLEIGCGWGGLAERLLERGCHVTGVTLSPAQLAFAQARLDQSGMADRSDLRLQDYRDISGQFDRIVSIEMLEAVGEEYWPAYFATLKSRLAPSGVAVLQTISIADETFESYRKDVDFIQRYIFPGGMLPSVQVMRCEIARAGLQLQEVHLFGDSYAQTLVDWNRRFQSAWPSIQLLGFDNRFKRMWEYYLGYCEGGFRAGAVNVGLYRITAA